jgi:phosphoserine phosphatase RsbU/P
MQSDTLAEVLASERGRFGALAAAWLENGADALGLSLRQRPGALWSRNPQAHPTLRVPIMLGRDVQGDLWIDGPVSAGNNARLRADAEMISALLHREEEVQSITSDLVEAQDQLLALYDLNRTLGHHLSARDSLADLAAQTARMMRCDRAFAGLLDGDALSVLVQHPADVSQPEELRRFFLRAAASLGAVTLSESNPEREHDVPRHALVVTARLRNGQRVGMGWSRVEDAPFGSPDMKLAQALVAQAGVRVESAMMYESSLSQTRISTELELARRIQQRLLPVESPVIAGVEIAARTQPAYEMGGDFYDHIEAPNRPVMFCLGDVSGKGLGAASLMSVTRTAIRTHSRYMSEASPAAVLNRTNEDLDQDLNRAGMFTTVFCGQYEPTTGLLTYSNAGHSPVIYCTADGACHMLEAEQPPLGILSELSCSDTALTMQPGDVLVVASDGLPEASNTDGEMLGYARFMEAINHSIGRPALDILEHLLSCVRDFSGAAAQSDDQTLIILKRTH